MNSRERVNSALNHVEPDKVPIDLGGDQSSIHIKAYKRLLEYLEIEDKNIRFADFVEQNVVPCNEVLERFQVDTRYIRPIESMIKEDFVPEQEGKYVGIYDQFGIFYGNFADKNVEEILYYDPVIHPLEDVESVQEIHDYDWPNGKDKRPFKNLRAEAKKLREKTDFALVSPPIGCIFENCTFLFGFTKAIRYTLKRPELIRATMEELLRYWIDYNEVFLGEIGEYLDVVCVNGDLGTQHGPWIDVKIYEKLIQPYEKALAQKIHELAPVKINYHSCGAVSPFIPYFAENGYDAFNPVQVSARGMEPCKLKQLYGHLITFWGGACDTQQILPFGTPEQIRDEVRYNMNCLKPNGGHIAANIHNITAEVPPENIVSLFDSIIEFREYEKSLEK
ncbi:MAG: uroporphyrinogen decarboxylase family protein [Promethearchaeota archaeon]